jgi:hypothetical protein
VKHQPSQHSELPSAKRLPYSQPAVIDYGSVAELTEAKSNGGSDSQVGNQHNA